MSDSVPWTHTTGGLVNVAAAAHRYIQTRRTHREFSTGTVVAVRCTLASFARELPDVPIGSVKARHIERWLTNRKVSDSSLRTQYSRLRGFTAWCVRQGYLKADPCAGIRGPRQPRSVPRGMSAEHVTKLLLACDDNRVRLCALLMAQEALRCCEVARLELGDIDMMDWVALVVGKANHERFVPLSAQTTRAVVDYLGEYPTTAGPLIRSYKHPTEPLTPAYIGTMVARAMLAAGIKERPRDGKSAHALRHTALQAIHDNGASLEQVRQIAGHASMTSVAIYQKRRAAVTDLRAAIQGREY